MFRFVKTVVIGTILFQSHDVYAEEPTVEEILRKADDLFRREHSMVTMEMTVKTARYERNMKMQAVSYGTEKTMITILEPTKEAGTVTLKVDNNIWNY